MENIVVSKEGFMIENLNPQLATIYSKYPENGYNGFDNNILVLDFGKKNKGDLIECSLKFTGNINISKTGASCGCTTPSFVKTEDGYVVNIVFDSYKVTNSVSKIVYIYDGNKTLKINLIINKS
jgi:hypothetical protein